jgi:hypothetical protein
MDRIIMNNVEQIDVFANYEIFYYDFTLYSHNKHISN